MENILCDCTPQNPEIVKEIKEGMPDFSLLLDLSDFFKVFGDSTRLQLLVALEKQELCVSDLANILNRKKSIISHQLKTLKISKLIKSRKVGRSVLYSLDDDHVYTILKMAQEHIAEQK